MPLFTPQELADHLGGTVAVAHGEAAERLVWGWLKPILGLSERPNPVPDEVWSWAIELGAIAHENPSGMSSKQLGPSQQAFSLERRREILAEASGDGQAAGAPPAPRGSFPAALPYPDPVRR